MTRAALLALAFALLAAAPAQADITVTNVKAAPVSPQAGAHSNFTLSFDLGSSNAESIKDLDVALPAGLLGNPNSASRCTKAQFDSDTCPADSKVGTQTVNADVGLLPGQTLNGEVFNLVPQPGEPARLGIKLDPPAGLPLLPTTHLESPVRVRAESDSGLTSILRDIPNTSSGMTIKINSISLTLNADGAKGAKFMTNPTSCAEAVTKLHAVGHAGGVADGQGGFTPTGCDKLPFAPMLSATVGGEGMTAARSNTSLSTVISQGPGEAASKSAVVTLAQPLTPNVGALANVCKLVDYDADKCPENSVVGQAQAITPLLPTPLAGPVRIVENPGSLPRLVVYLNGLINLRLSGDIGLTAAGTTTTFAKIPDVPLSRFQLDFGGGPSGLVGTTADLCKSKVLIGGQFTAQSGKAVTLTSEATVAGCGATTPAGAKAPVAAVALRRLKSSSPVLSVRVKKRAGGRRLRAVAVSLPSGLSFDRARLRAGVRATAGARKLGRRGISFRGKRTLRLRTASKKGADRIAGLVARGALRVSPSLRRRVAKHPRVRVTIRATDAKGKVYTLRKRVRVG